MAAASANPVRRETPQVAKKPLRVLMVTGAYPTPQVPHSGTFIKSQVDSLIEAGVDVEVIHPTPGPVPLRYMSAATQVFFKTLTRRFDVVHGHYSTWCLAARLQWTTPLVVAFLGSDVFNPPLADHRYSKKGTLTGVVSRWLSQRVDAVIVKSEAMREAIPAKSVYVIPNGVDLDLFHPVQRSKARAALGWNPHGCYVLFGNNPKIPVKDFPLAQLAIERLRARGVSVELVVATGLPHATVAQYINASNALLLTSKSEGSPNIVKEAMACNVPVVATDVGDVAQVIGHTAGCYVCPSDPDALATGLQKALEYPTPTTGRADIAHLANSLVAEQVIAVYEHVIDEWRKVGRAHARTA